MQNYDKISWRDRPNCQKENVIHFGIFFAEEKV